MKRILCSVIVLLLCVQCFTALPSSGAEVKNQDDIVILYTNDVHCGVTDVIGYDGLMLYKKEIQSQYENVLLVDAGDAIQGDSIGALTEGEDIIELMNSVGYDLATIGNHEFDYGREQLEELSAEIDCGYICCNYIDLRTGQPVYDPYRIVTLGGKKIAFVGATTPQAITTPAYFQDDEGHFIYSLCQGEGELYRAIQQSADAARNEGADIVILLGHLGEFGDEGYHGWSAEEVIANTDNIDVMIDGHSHTVTPKQMLKNKDGQEIPVTQAGTKLQYIGRVTIGADNSIDTGLIDTVPAPTPDMGIPDDAWFCDADRGRNVDSAINQTIIDMTQEIIDQLGKTVGHTDFDLTANDPATGLRAIRNAETNLGDFCADFFREYFGADVGLITGGNIRADIPAGDITLMQTLTTFPFLNYPASATVTGQQIKDFLELGVALYPGESSSFCHVSGLTYEFDDSIPTSVQVDEDVQFIGVFGPYRIQSITMSDGTPLDVNAHYTIAMTTYQLRDGGDHGVFSKNISDLTFYDTYDYEMLGDFISEMPGGAIPAAYENPYGQNRITAFDGSNLLLGDANLDGAVDITDATTVQRFDIAVSSLSPTAQKVADVDRDGEVCIIDATWLQRYVSHMNAPEGIGQPIGQPIE